MTIPPNPHPEQVEITQEDREAAAKIYEWFTVLSSTPKAALKTAQHIRDGDGDGWTTVQHFARHRRASLANRPADDGELERLALQRALDRIGWPEIHAFQEEMRRGQNIYEDAGGYFLRAIKALFGVRSRDPVTTYRDAAAALLAALPPQPEGVKRP